MCSYFPRGPLVLARCCCCCWRDANSDAEAPDDPLKPAMQCEPRFPYAESRIHFVRTRQSDAGERSLILLVPMAVKQRLLLLLLLLLPLILLLRRLRRRRERRRHARHVTTWFTSCDEDLTQTKISVRSFGKIGILCYAVWTFVHSISILKVLCQFQS